MKAHIIPPNGPITTIELTKKPSLDQYYQWIGTDVVQSVGCRLDGKAREMVIDEEGKLKGRPYNVIASGMFHARHPECVGDPIVGTAVVCEGFRL